jgi:hypothetical protein
MPPKRQFTTEHVTHLAKHAFHQHGPNLSLQLFSQLSGLSIGIIQLRLGSWLRFKQSLGLNPQPAPPTRPTHSRAHILDQLRQLISNDPHITLARFSKHTRISEKTVTRHFGSWTSLRREAGLKPNHSGRDPIPDQSLLADLHRVYLPLWRFPTMDEYTRLGRSSVKTLLQRFGSWKTAEQLHDEFFVTLMRRTNGPDDRQQIMTRLLTYLPNN